jgi:hypothetical protein
MRNEGQYWRERESFPEHSALWLRRHIILASQPTLALLEDWLGGEAEIKERADERKMTFTMTFIHRRLGTLGELDLVYGGRQALPRGVNARICIGDGGVPDEPAHVGKRRAMMEEIYSKAQKQFILRLRWGIFYYWRDRLLESRTVAGDNITKVKDLAYRGRPRGTDMIKLVPPKGQGGTLIYTEDKQWVSEG